MTDDSIEDILKDTKRAAKDLARASAELSRRLLTKAEVAARNPGGTARKAGKQLADELDAATREVERILKDL
jgi:F0F1-type ATP synthase membrane subunit b/b'